MIIKKSDSYNPFSNYVSVWGPIFFNALGPKQCIIALNAEADMRIQLSSPKPDYEDINYNDMQ